MQLREYLDDVVYSMVYYRKNGSPGALIAANEEKPYFEKNLENMIVIYEKLLRSWTLTDCHQDVYSVVNLPQYELWNGDKVAIVRGTKEWLLKKYPAIRR